MGGEGAMGIIEFIFVYVLLLVASFFGGFVLGANYTDRKWVALALKALDKKRDNDDADWWKKGAP